ncbi:MAG: hypothetical protein AB7U41_07480, partial [Dongiaceae bacterium]
MPWNGNGTFTRIHNWITDKNNSIKILAARQDDEDNNFATGIQACLARNNETKPTADFAPNTDASLTLGSNALRWLRGLFSGSIRLYNGSSNYVDLAAGTLTGNRNITLPDAPGQVILDTNGI